MLIGEPTCRLVRAAAEVEPREPVEAKGKSEPVAAYRLVGVTAAGQAPRQDAARSPGARTSWPWFERSTRSKPNAPAGS